MGALAAIIGASLGVIWYASGLGAWVVCVIGEAASIVLQALFGWTRILFLKGKLWLARSL